MGCESSKPTPFLCGRNVAQTLRPSTPPWTRSRGPAALFPGPYGRADTAIPHILLLGPSGSGKSTLLYATLLPGWKGTSTLTPTRPLHYEELSRGNVRIGVWDVSGSDAMRSLWPTMYQLISVSVIVFVVSVQSSDEIVVEARIMIRRLLSEASLSGTAFVLVFNTLGLDENSDGFQTTLSKLEQQLGLFTLTESTARTQDKRPVMSVVVDAHHAAEDGRWRRTLDWIFKACLSEGVNTDEQLPLNETAQSGTPAEPKSSSTLKPSSSAKIDGSRTSTSRCEASAQQLAQATRLGERPGPSITKDSN